MWLKSTVIKAEMNSVYNYFLKYGAKVIYFFSFFAKIIYIAMHCLMTGVLSEKCVVK